MPRRTDDDVPDFFSDAEGNLVEGGAPASLPPRATGARIARDVD